ncbi:MAG: hypothetical protein L3J24_07875 [Xanthomonadales bacterium]|nr:hypothetical protein [Xanthomonadales bacterium]
MSASTSGRTKPVNYRFSVQLSASSLHAKARKNSLLSGNPPPFEPPAFLALVTFGDFLWHVSASGGAYRTEVFNKDYSLT